MASKCPICSRTNPDEANYCYFDGGPLTNDRAGPMQIGSAPFPMKFYFSDSQSCGNFNQLALACHNHWEEARSLLVEDVWPAFFRTMGRNDLAANAKFAAQHVDRDYGLCQFLEKLPADPGVVRPPKLAADVSEVNLGRLSPGADRNFDLTFYNQGMLMLHGSIATNCDWLVFGDEHGAASRVFETRNSCSIPVRVLGGKLRAGVKQLIGEILVESNGGAVTIPVKADIPITPFPKGDYPNNVLAGVKSPRELAIKAKEFPKEAGVLFQQAAVKAWYQSNGWTYPVEGTAGTGKGAVQQFFEALGLTKPPQLEINVDSLVLSGKVGEVLTETVTISTKESRHVYAQGWSNRDWMKIGTAKQRGNQVDVPIRITIPAQPGETLEATATIEGNGKKRFLVPVSLTPIAGKRAGRSSASSADRRVEKPASWFKRPVTWISAAALVLLAGGGFVALSMNGDRPGPKTSPQPVAPPDFAKLDPVVPPKSVSPKLVSPKPFTPKPPTPVAKSAWWDGIENTRLPAAWLALKKSAPAEQAILDQIAMAPDHDRAYDKLLAATPNLLLNPSAKQPLAEFVADCFVFDPFDPNAMDIRKWLTRQLPAKDAAFAAKTKDLDLDRAFWALGVSVDAICNPHAGGRRARVNGLAETLRDSLGLVVDADTPVENRRTLVGEQANRLLAERYYRNLLPTVDKNVDLALDQRDVLIEKTKKHLASATQNHVDILLIVKGLSKDAGAWPKFEPIVRNILENEESPAKLRAIVELYRTAKPALAAKMEPVLAEKWKAAGRADLDHAAKIKAIQTALSRTPADRPKLMHKVAADALAAAAKDKQQGAPALAGAVRLAHASALACALFSSDQAEAAERFDARIDSAPTVDGSGKASAKKIAGIVVGEKLYEDKHVWDAKKSDREVGHLKKVYLFAFTANRTYVIEVDDGRKHNPFSLRRDPGPFLRLEDPDGKNLTQKPDGTARAASKMQHTPSKDGTYRLTVLTAEPAAPGASFTLQLQQQRAAAPQKAGGEKGIAELADPRRISEYVGQLDGKVSRAERIEAFGSIAYNVTDEVPFEFALPIARYLLSKGKEDLKEGETNLEVFSKSCNLPLALADAIQKEDVTRESAEFVIGGISQRNVRLDELDWRPPCRKLLLQRAVELSLAKQNAASRAAESLSEYYHERGLAFGMNADDFDAKRLPSQTLAEVVKRFVAKAQDSRKADKAYLDRIDRKIEAAQILPDNDIERTVLLQRLWIAVSVDYLANRFPEHAKEIERWQTDLIEQDRSTSGAIDQLRAGEECALRLWMMANEIKAK